MVELRWVIPEGTSTKSPRLQYRTHPPDIDASGALCPGPCWSEWLDVPLVVVDEAKETPNHVDTSSPPAVGPALYERVLAAVTEATPTFVDPVDNSLVRCLNESARVAIARAVITALWPKEVKP